MTGELNVTKKRLFRKRILQLGRELYLHPQMDTTVMENLKAGYPELSVRQVRELFAYLEKKRLVTLRTNKNRMSMQITPTGIDVLDGAVEVRGVDPSDPKLTRLGYKKELRRGILRYCHTFHDFYNEDTEIHAEFKNSGFANLLIEEIRFHMWYLKHKSYLDLKTIGLGGDLYFMARITAAGADLAENSVTDVGVSNETN